jgi:uncharacterized repeat protein (TIGR03803 family)
MLKRRQQEVFRSLMVFGTMLAALAAPPSFAGVTPATPTEPTHYAYTPQRGGPSTAGLIIDGSGKLYGTTRLAGGYGAVFEITPPGTGQSAWTEKIIHFFDKADGDYPFAGLIADGAGNVYGTTGFGGGTNVGVVFELSPPAEGKKAWTESIVHSFNGADGYIPMGSLIMDSVVNLYGATAFGGAYPIALGYGVVFELSPPPPGGTTWTETVLFSFDGYDGFQPQAGLIEDAAGNLYGTTAYGGANNDGEVFELSPPQADGTIWTLALLVSFNGPNGLNPQSSLVADAAGNLYGTTFAGGDHGDGVVFELTPPKKGGQPWTEKVLYSFNGTKGSNPAAGLLADAAGNLYGTTQSGGVYGDGVVFDLRPPADGKRNWTERVLHNFNGIKGGSPGAGVISDGQGGLYGTTEYGSAHDDGVVFKLTP